MPYTEKRRRFIINFAYVGVITLIVYLVFKYLLGILMPFIIGFFIASALSALARVISKKFSLSKKFVSVVLVFLFYLTVGTLAVFASIKLFVAIGKIFAHLPELYNSSIAPALSKLFDFIGGVLKKFDNSLSSDYGSLFENVELSLGSAVSTLSISAVSFISGLLANLPMFIIELVLGIVSTFFFAADYANITGFIMSLFPQKSREKICNVKKSLMSILIKYGKSYFLIMMITFGELYLGLTLAGVKNALVPSFLIAVFDILPILGVGLVLVPWGVFSLLAGQVRLGSMILILFVIISIVRNIIEPKIVGREVGLHPVLALISMFVGTRLFGLIGLFGLPTVLSLIKSLEDSGVIRLWYRDK